jgi:hypothetical protein
MPNFAAYEERRIQLVDEGGFVEIVNPLEVDLAGRLRRIPTDINVQSEYEAMLAENRALLSLDDLNSLLKDKGINSSDILIVTPSDKPGVVEIYMMCFWSEDKDLEKKMKSLMPIIKDHSPIACQIVLKKMSYLQKQKYKKMKILK